MSNKNQRFNQIIWRERLKRGLIWGPILGAIFGGLAALILLTRDPTTHVRFTSGTLDDTIVSEDYDGTSVYWLIQLPDGSRAQIGQPIGTTFEAGRKVCLDAREGDWSGRTAFYLTSLDKCDSADQ